MSSTQGFHAIMNLFLMPMWFMSGALFPASGAWKGLRYVMLANPLTYGLAALRRAIDPHDAGALGLPGFGVSLLVTIGFTVVMFVLAARVARSTVAADLQ
jgi:ABC-type polysaccharide/polyol phosphate export permease